MKTIFCRQFILSGFILCLGFCQPSVSHAGMLGDLWGSIVGFFTGKKKNDPAMEAQIASLLEQTNQSQNSLIASINELLSYQKTLSDLNRAEDKDKMNLMMQSMQQTIQTNQDNFLQLMQVREQLAQAGELQKYEQNIQQFVQKQQEIEGYYPKIEDRYNELLAFSEKPIENNSESLLSQDSKSASESVEKPWQYQNIQVAIDQYLDSNDLDEWGGPKVENAKIGRPPGAGDRTRYQYLWEANPNMRDALQELVESQVVGNEQIAKPADNSELSVTEPEAPSSPNSSFQSENASKVSRTNMAFTNRYDNVDLRNQRKDIYQRLLEMQNSGEMNSESYKDLYHEYTILGQKLKKTSN
tara:strand:- start:2984 stop:4051 length:1068 start_codon:yes stop_codon:yes gene_type:complete